MNLAMPVIAAIVCLGAGMLEGQTKRRLQAADLPHSWTGSRTDFDRLIGELEQRSKDRLNQGQNDHLIAYVLQSRRFTNEPAIEPALSAMEFVRNGSGPIPDNVSRRIDAFLKTSRRPDSDERTRYFQEILGGRGKPYLIGEYARAMRFLYEKETKQAANLPPAGLYQERGYASDTQVEATFAVWTALAVLKSLEPALKIHSVLVVGPGIDLAPRTGLIDVLPPQSYQPFAVADGLLSLGMAVPGRLRVHAVDINPLVVRFFEAFPRSHKELALVSGLRRNQLSSDFLHYFENLGRHIGKESALDLPPDLTSHLSKSLIIQDDVARNVTAGELNILTDRYDPSPAYDLVVVTNVLVYFNSVELRLALANIHSMLRPGGYLVHNEPRLELELASRDLGLVPIQGRTIRISDDRISAKNEKPLLDSFVIQKRSDPAIPSDAKR